MILSMFGDVSKHSIGQPQRSLINHNKWKYLRVLAGPLLELFYTLNDKGAVCPLEQSEYKVFTVSDNEGYHFYSVCIQMYLFSIPGNTTAAVIYFYWFCVKGLVYLIKTMFQNETWGRSGTMGVWKWLVMYVKFIYRAFLSASSQSTGQETTNNCFCGQLAVK